MLKGSTRLLACVRTERDALVVAGHGGAQDDVAAMAEHVAADAEARTTDVHASDALTAHQHGRQTQQQHQTHGSHFAIFLRCFSAWIIS